MTKINYDTPPTMENYIQTLLKMADTAMGQHIDLIRPLRDLAQKRLQEHELERLSARRDFEAIYHEGLWGRSEDPEQRYFSGSGSHDAEIVSVYCDAVNNFLRSLPSSPNAVDLGCGDFYVGRQLRPFCNSYIACDIVPGLIEFNKKRFCSLNVDFRVHDLVKDPLPRADILFLRQVLQHLSNAEIQQFVNKLTINVTWLVLTEHIPLSANFQHNLDLENRQHIRLVKDSGVVLTSPPFHLKCFEERVLCDVQKDVGRIRTVLYRLRN